MDDIEKEYERRILQSDTDEAAELVEGLRQYRELFKDIYDEEER